MTIAAALLLLAALAATMSYTCYLVVGVLADYLDSSRIVAGLLLGGLFARFPWIRTGRPRIVGLIPKPARRPAMAGLLALCLLRFMTQSDAAAASCAGFALAFVVGFPWLKNALFARMSSSIFKFTAGRNTPVAANDNVIEGEFRERKE